MVLAEKESEKPVLTGKRTSALGVGGLLLTRWRRDRVKILHHTLQVPHLVVQLLRAVAAVAVLEKKVNDQNVPQFKKSQYIKMNVLS